MEEKNLKKVKWLIAVVLLVALITGTIYVMSSNNAAVKSVIPLTDPETGIQNWIEAVNQRNIDRLYDLSPDEIKQQKTLPQFKEDNLNNTLLQPGHYFINFTEIDRKQNGTYAQIAAQVFLHQPVNQGTLGPEIPIGYRFALYYEHGEWKIWTLKW